MRVEFPNCRVAETRSIRARGFEPAHPHAHPAAELEGMRIKDFWQRGGVRQRIQPAIWQSGAATAEESRMLCSGGLAIDRSKGTKLRV